MRFLNLAINATAFTSLIALAGCGSADGDKATIIFDCNLAAHQEIEGTSRDGVNKEFILGELVNSCLKNKGLRPATNNPGCSIEAKTPEQGKPYIKPSQECWVK